MSCMRRLIAITAFALFSLFAVPVWAQHGGGHGGGGGGHAGGFSGGHASGGFSGHCGFSGGHSGFSGSRAFSGEHSASGSRPFTPPSSSFTRPSVSQRSFSRPFLHDGFRGNGFRGNGTHIHIRTYGNNCWGYVCRGGYGWGYPWGYYDPWWWGDNDSSYDNDYNDNVAAAADMNRQNLEEQQMLRQEQADGDQDAYARPPEPPAARGEEAQGQAMIPSTVLVFRDQHKEEIENYAIVGHTLWNFSPQHTEKISLSDLDLDATTKANEDRGVTFRIPAPGEAQ